MFEFHLWTDILEKTGIEIRFLENKSHAYLAFEERRHGIRCCSVVPIRVRSLCRSRECHALPGLSEHCKKLRARSPHKRPSCRCQRKDTFETGMASCQPFWSRHFYMFESWRSSRAGHLSDCSAVAEMCSLVPIGKGVRTKEQSEIIDSLHLRWEESWTVSSCWELQLYGDARWVQDWENNKWAAKIFGCKKYQAKNSKTKSVSKWCSTDQKLRQKDLPHYWRKSWEIINTPLSSYFSVCRQFCTPSLTPLAHMSRTQNLILVFPFSVCRHEMLIHLVFFCCAWACAQHTNSKRHRGLLKCLSLGSSSSSRAAAASRRLLHAAAVHGFASY